MEDLEHYTQKSLLFLTFEVCIRAENGSCLQSLLLFTLQVSPGILACTVKMKVFTAHHFVPIHTLLLFLVCVLGQFSVQYTLSFLQCDVRLSLWL